MDWLSRKTAAYEVAANQIPLDEMNEELSELDGKSLYFAKRSLEEQFDGIDSGDDDLFNRIIWFAMKGDLAYPENYSGEDQEDDENIFDID